MNQKKLAPAPMAMPIAARITLTGSRKPLGQRLAEADEDEEGGQNAKDDHKVHGPRLASAPPDAYRLWPSGAGHNV